MTLLRAEWTKLRTVRRWMLSLLCASAFIVGFGLLVASQSHSDVNRLPNLVVGPDGSLVDDDFHFVHRPLTGDGTVVARVASQAGDNEKAAAGVMLKRGLTPGSPYAALMVTPGDGIRLGANFAPDVAGRSGGAPHWLKLSRSGNRITGFESADGTVWREVGHTDLAGLPETVDIGLFVNSPPKVFEGDASRTPTTSTARFDNVSLVGAEPGPWSNDDVRGQALSSAAETGGAGTEANGTFTVTGTGAIGPHLPDDDPVQFVLFGVILAIIAVITVGVLSITSEYRRGMIRATFTANPHRIRVLAAKAVVLGGTTFGIGLATSVITVLATRSMLLRNGYTPPAYPPIALTDGPVLRAIVGTALFMALIAVFSLAVGAILRHSAGAITTVLGLVIFPIVAGATLLSAEAGRWLTRISLTSGFALQRAQPPADAMVEAWSSIAPAQALAVVSAYTLLALVLAAWLMRRRDA